MVLDSLFMLSNVYHVPRVHFSGHMHSSKTIDHNSMILLHKVESIPMIQSSSKRASSKLFYNSKYHCFNSVLFPASVEYSLHL